MAALLIAGSLVACSKDEVPGPNRTPLDPNGNIAFPDAKFAAYMVKHFDTNKDGGISPAEAAAITTINCPGMEIVSLAGIEYCTELTHLDCYKNKLTSLNVSKNTKLTTLGCDDNQLTTLDVSRCTELTSLFCYDNQLTTLDISKSTKLTWLSCNNNQLTSLNVSKNTNLTYLYCNDNKLTELDVSMTNLISSDSSYPLQCAMPSLETLYLNKDWEGRIGGIDDGRDSYWIAPTTTILYK